MILSLGCRRENKRHLRLEQNFKKWPKREIQLFSPQKKKIRHPSQEKIKQTRKKKKKKKKQWPLVFIDFLSYSPKRKPCRVQPPLFRSYWNKYWYAIKPNQSKPTFFVYLSSPFSHRSLSSLSAMFQTFFLFLSFL